MLYGIIKPAEYLCEMARVPGKVSQACKQEPRYATLVQDERHSLFGRRASTLTKFFASVNSIRWSPLSLGTLVYANI